MKIITVLMMLRIKIYVIKHVFMLLRFSYDVCKYLNLKYFLKQIFQQ